MIQSIFISISFSFTLPPNSTKSPGPNSPSVQSPGMYSERPFQKWTIDGYPIAHVEGADHFMGGPSSVSIYWQNRVSTGRGNQFLDVTEYLARLGEFLRKGLCKVDSLNATRFDVYVVASSEFSQLEFRNALQENGLL
ncbi:hypothetical protein C8A03DRAFT_47263 [Achaetomium macrosporum]|uniref:Uncharacterized protein n=1 Tax=Achaetomium macrosporum TaxID=79813 RepID=A0AAN7C2Y1_9PEZI|nr:hypothetical protein C8A03DRAFT_47263 [Achaetomium macrosporum]